MHLDAFQQQVSPLIFSQRRRALEHLEHVVRSRLRMNASWPDLLLDITPEDLNRVVEYMQIAPETT